MKLAIIDLDGVIADNTARFAKAEEAKAAYLASQDWEDGTACLERQATDLYWRTAFMPDLLRLDTVIDGTQKALEQISNFHEYDIYFLTSRPEAIREATMRWLFWNIDFDSETHLIMKPASAQFVKTVTWKAGVVELLVRVFGIDELLFVDDEPAIQEAIAALDLPCDRKIGGNLQEALAMLEA